MRYLSDSKNLLQVGLLFLLAFLPFQTFFTVWLAHGSSDRIIVLSLWKEVLILLLVGVVLLIFKQRVFRTIWRDKLLLVMAGYLALCLIYVLLADDRYRALAGAAVNTRFLLAFGVAFFAAQKLPDLPRRMMKVVLIAACLVAFLGIVQASILPKDILTHFGYDRPPQNTFDIPPAYHLVGDTTVRAQGTLRGPNILGAYLILPLSIAAVIAYRNKKARISALGIILLCGLAVLLSYSRSAWLGAAAAMLFLAATVMRSRKVLWFGLVGVTCLAVLLFAFRQSEFVNQTILHEDTASSQSSNEGHLAATSRAARAVASNPWGNGLGSAGPVSTLTPETTIAENYFLQVGQEMGWIGLSLLVAIHVLILMRLIRHSNEWFALALAASLIGLTITNLLLHTWADEAVAITWWITAGLLLGMNPSGAILNKERKHDEIPAQEKTKTRSQTHHRIYGQRRGVFLVRLRHVFCLGQRLGSQPLVGQAVGQRDRLACQLSVAALLGLQQSGARQAPD